MTRSAGRLLGLLSVFVLVALILAPGSATALNVPGSPLQVTPKLTEEATVQLSHGVHDNVRQARTSDGITVSTSGVTDADGETDLTAFASTMTLDGGWSIVSDYRWQNITQNSEFEGDINSFSLIAIKYATPSLGFFGGLIGESYDGDTDYNDGSVSAEGLGLTLGVDYMAAENFYIVASVGRLGMDYETVHSNGLVRGDYSSDVTYAKITGDTSFADPRTLTSLQFGLTWVHQENDAYTESNGRAVGSSSVTSTYLTASSRTEFATGLPVDPFFESQFAYQLSDDDDLPVALFRVNDERVSGRAAFGVSKAVGAGSVEAAIGFNVTEQGYTGMDAVLRGVITF
ncbi:autotransporter outer membrane beta-barrel domain-containing protein [Pelagovum pacificum]|uniref:Autotransporter outer membrane beta-barrel domain-containing protein n=1 Tax=Pelagovum pacificum TaxID=2588711 RepID=A0A5C5GEY3_9RHOB|nr:autotransporter outer membrane beta-barrel domain-containing protein [Pelagovum pacificum]QQA43597.1 autotransporter outer membrane beta-barrel domain-containing protein [Pelagovum pacificum]TNY33268.1 autotransporter outer membrane beta-barrel domain-containing protein [Pelagovum pacificum]